MDNVLLCAFGMFLWRLGTGMLILRALILELWIFDLRKLF